MAKALTMSGFQLDVSGSSSEDTFRVLAERGPVYAAELIPQTNTFADLTGATVTIQENANEIIRDVPLHRFSQAWQEVVKSFKLEAPEQSEITVEVNNPSGASYAVSLVLWHKEKTGKKC